MNPFSTEEVPIEELIPYARNPRIHKASIDKVAASIKEFGFRQPIVVDSEMVVIAGHGRLQAALKIGLSHVPVHIATELTPEQIRAYRLADNRIAQESAWDEELLALELMELEAAGASLENTAFDVAELDAYLAGLNQPDSDPDAVPEIPSEPITQNGDVWELGNHRLVCGDATDAESYIALLGDAKADMVYTDPPYNVAYQSKAGSIKNDDLSNAEFQQLLQGTFTQVSRHIREGAPVYVSYSEKETENFYRTLREAGLKQSSCLIWLKNNLVLGRGDYHSRHEPIWYGWKPGASHSWHGGRKQTTLAEAEDLLPVSSMKKDCWMLNWSDLHVLIKGKEVTVEAIESSVIEQDKPKRSELHPTMKPVRLLEQLLRNSSARGEVILDAFGGSGSTLIACENLNRSARLIELDPAYCDVIVQRWQDYTGKQATHAKTGTPFAEVK